ncbi:MAG: CHRD domain-containing protein [Janthinobacterium lividum]
MTGTYDPGTKLLTYTVTYAGLTGAPTMGHFHYGDAKHTGAVFIPFSNLPTGTSGTITGSTTLTTTAATSTSPAVSQPDSFSLGHVYANIHTSQYPSGEIRANVVVK